MAAAAIKNLAHGHGQKFLRSNSKASSQPKLIDHEQQEKEKHFIAGFTELTRPLSPHQIAKDPRNKELGVTSRQLTLKDFELLKTIGTGLDTSKALLNDRSAAD